jgi:hypothetical protein
MPRAAPKFRVVGEESPSLADFTFEFRKALSAAAGKRIGDDYRAEILSRDFAAVHIAGDRAPVLRLPASWRAPR